MWNQVKNNSELLIFLNLMNCFHDSCIKEMRYFSGAYVDAELAMYPVNDHRMLNVIIQRQDKHFSMIEMEFSGLRCLKLTPIDDTFTCEIHNSTMLLSNGFVYWCDCGGLSETTLDSYEGTFICASELRWRPIDNCMGQDEFYLPKV